MKQQTPNYRIYALVIGEIIPLGEILDCKIKKISFKEQREKRFSPIKSVFSNINEPYGSYASSLQYVDPLKIKSKYAIVCDVKERCAKSAIGEAVKRIDRICKFLTFTYAEDFRKKTQIDCGLHPYLYQVNKICSLDNDKELDIDFKLESGGCYLPDRPTRNEWRHSKTEKFLEDMMNFRDETLERATSYLYRSSVGQFINDNPEKILLDHFKAIEIIINSLLSKKSQKKSFSEKVKEAAKKINLTKEEEDLINIFWKDRSEYSDTAHPSLFDHLKYLPNQYPLPQSNLSHARWNTNNTVALNVCMKYFLYKRNIFEVDIEESPQGGREVMGTVNEQWESNHLLFMTPEKGKEKIKGKIKKVFSLKYKVKKEDIVVKILPGRKKAEIEINKIDL